MGATPGRDRRAFQWLDDAWRDAGYAIRALARSPGFTTAAVVTLALGIGATTAIVSIVDRVLLQPLGFPQSDRLVSIAEPERPRTMNRTNYREYLEWRARTTTLSGLAGPWRFSGRPGQAAAEVAHDAAAERDWLVQCVFE